MPDERKFLLVLGIASLAVCVAAATLSLAGGGGTGAAIVSGVLGVVFLGLAMRWR